MTLGNRIASLRKAAGLSQEALAAKLGVSRQAIGKWEADATLPSLDNLHQLAKELGVSIDALLTGEETDAQSTPEAGPPQTPLSLEGVQALLEGQARSDRRRQKRTLFRLGVPTALAVLALAAGLAWQNGQLASLRNQLGTVQGSVATLDGSVAALQSRLSAGILGQGQTTFSESLLASWDVQVKEYSPAESRVQMSLSATPRTITEDCALRFTFVLSDGQSLSLDATRGEGDVFFAEGWVPLAESYTLNVSLIRDGETKVEQLYTEPAFSSQYEMQIQELPPRGAKRQPHVFFQDLYCAAGSGRLRDPRGRVLRKGRPALSVACEGVGDGHTGRRRSPEPCTGYRFHPAGQRERPQRTLWDRDLLPPLFAGGKDL